MNFKKINEKILGPRIKWMDRNGYLKLKNSIVVKVMLTSRGNKGQYTGYKVVIISNSAGVLDGKFFNFKEFLVPTYEGNIGKTIYVETDLAPADLDLPSMGSSNLFNVNVTQESVELFKKTIWEYINLFE